MYLKETQLWLKIDTLIRFPSYRVHISGHLMLANQEMIEDDKNTFLFSVIECRVHRVQKPPSLSMLQITGTVSPSQVLTLKFTNSMILSLPFVWPKYLHTHNLFPPQFSKIFLYFSLSTARNNEVTLHSNYKPG